MSDRAVSHGTIRVGMAGWQFAPWRGTFYPEKLPQKRELEYASRAVSTIELNGSFYALQRPESYARWYAETAPDFVFSVKAPKYITHIAKLREVETPVANFLASGLANLREKLGPVLWQLPPTMTLDRERLERFVALLPHAIGDVETLAGRHDAKVDGRAVTRFDGIARLRHAIEVRNATFVDASFIALLRERGVALVIADSAGRWPELDDLTADFVYVRLHGADVERHPTGYPDDALDAWAGRLRAWSEGREPAQARPTVTRNASAMPRDVFCYFDNTAKESTPANAQRLMRTLGITRTHEAVARAR